MYLLVSDINLSFVFLSITVFAIALAPPANELTAPIVAKIAGIEKINLPLCMSRICALHRFRMKGLIFYAYLTEHHLSSLLRFLSLWDLFLD